jgi:hypothetical protein
MEVGFKHPRTLRIKVDLVEILPVINHILRHFGLAARLFLADTLFN